MYLIEWNTETGIERIYVKNISWDDIKSLQKKLKNDGVYGNIKVYTLLDTFTEIDIQTGENKIDILTQHTEVLND